MGSQRIAHTGGRPAVNQDIGGAGNDRRGRKTFVIGAEVSDQNHRFAHIASFAFVAIHETTSPF
ncbi:hypothetical protein MSNKSG1_10418 [Marinobacter santoriniensis NKSG1]|uniref:Uncharacterized protein n=1 Tax=Marinobacter santoriniensis NKSG1 TaxID=1288826 RepID=M7CRL9_9GAMM|nr:hypothetical protein MSNKSG1_10418 [Marinobacter santoriniensis NKSG1]